MFYYFAIVKGCPADDKKCADINRTSDCYITGLTCKHKCNKKCCKYTFCVTNQLLENMVLKVEPYLWRIWSSHLSLLAKITLQQF